MRNVLWLGMAALFLVVMLALPSIVAVSAPPTESEISGLIVGPQVQPAAPVNPGTMASQIVVYNPDSAAATVSIRILDAGGNQAGTIGNFSLAANGLVVKPLPSTVASPFRGSAVVSSDKNVQALVLSANPGNTARDDYSGTGNPGTSVTFPLVRHLAKDTGNSILAVQNTSGSAVNITLHLYGQDGSEQTPTTINSVAPFASAYFDTNTIIGTGTFTGSAKATADGVALLAAGEQTRFQKDTASFHGLGAGDQGTSAVVNFVQHAGSPATSWNEIYVRNEGTNPTRVRAEYWNGAGVNTYSVTTTSPIAVNGMAAFNDSTYSALGTSWTGSVKLVSLDGQPISVYSLQVWSSGVSLFGTEGTPLAQLGTKLVCGDFIKQTTGNSKLNLLNPTNTSATATITLYDPSSGAQVSTKSVTVGPRKMVQVGSGSFTMAATTFEGVALVTSAMPLAVSVNTPYTVNLATAGVTAYTCAQMAAGSAPSSFAKTGPANNSTGQSTNPILSWGTSSAAVNYEYCIYPSNGSCGAWTPTSSVNATVTGLATNTSYTWQVRAVNGAGTTAADGGATWSFTTGSGDTLPGAFGKNTPANGATGQSKLPTVSWQASAGATSYELCVDTTNDNTCQSPYNWYNVGNVTTFAIPVTLNGGTTYYWQIRARNTSGTTEANTGTWWSFTTASGSLPSPFAKTSPVNGAIGQSTRPILKWNTSLGATSYDICVDTTNDNICQSTYGWYSVGNVTQFTLPVSLSSATVYYWEVRANNANGSTYANASTWWKFTTQ